jgi:hypothetical protein
MILNLKFERLPCMSPYSYVKYYFVVNISPLGSYMNIEIMFDSTTFHTEEINSYHAFAYEKS